VSSETAERVLAALRDRGMLLQSARGPIPNVPELVAGEPIKGSWWGHRAGHEISTVLNELVESDDVVRLRLIGKKITLVHRRVWPALVRVADRFPPEALAAIAEEHTSSGAHRTTSTPFPDWVPAEDLRAGRRLDVADALAQLPECLTKS